MMISHHQTPEGASPLAYFWWERY